MVSNQEILFLRLTDDSCRAIPIIIRMVLPFALLVQSVSLLTEIAYSNGPLRDRALITSVEFTLKRAFNPDLSYPRLREAIGPSSAHETLTAEELVETIVNIRKSRLPNPLEHPNAGSFFKNPVVTAEFAGQLSDAFPEAPRYPVANSGDDLCKLSAAWLIEKSGLKGYQSGLLQMSEQHALVLVHHPQAGKRADDGDVIKFASHIQSVVLKKVWC